VVALPPSSLLTPPIEPLGNACCAADVRQNALACNPAVASITAAECILLSPNASTRAPPPPVLSGRAASLPPVLIGHVSSPLP